MAVRMAMRVKNHIILSILLYCWTIPACAVDIQPVGNFSAGDLAGWERQAFKGKTLYQFVPQGKIQVLQAKSHAAASGLIKKQRIDLDATPYMNWQWRVDQRLLDLNEHTKPGDDYAARVYVIVSGGWAFWKTKVINYVWSSNQKKQSVWPNAFAGNNAMMVALRSRLDKTAVWHREKRHIKADFRQFFGNNIRYIDAVAIMTDTDNAGRHALAYYGDIFFSSE